MKFVITGGAGHISKTLVQLLLKSGNEVTVIGRNAENLKTLTELGAKAAIGSVEDVAFLEKAFAGADGVYTMIPPNFAAQNWKEYIAQIGKNYTSAIKAAGVKYVVNLSSVGAHLAAGCGPVSGLYFAEQSLNTLKDLTVVHLRPGYFYYNFYNNLSLVKNAGIIGSNFSADTKLVLSDTDDIAKAAAEELTAQKSKGHVVKYIASDIRTAAEVAKVLGSSVGIPELPWVGFSDEDSLNAMTQAGLPKEIAGNFVEMGGALANGAMLEEFFQNRPSEFGKVKLEDFAKHFSNAYSKL